MSPGETLTTDVRVFAGWQVVSLAGELDRSHADVVTALLKDAVERDGKGVVVDTTALTFADSAWLATFAAGCEAAQAHEKPYRLVAVTRPVLRLLHIAGMDRVFSIFATVEDAVADNATPLINGHKSG